MPSTASSWRHTGTAWMADPARSSPSFTGQVGPPLLHSRLGCAACPLLHSWNGHPSLGRRKGERAVPAHTIATLQSVPGSGQPPVWCAAMVCCHAMPSWPLVAWPCADTAGFADCLLGRESRFLPICLMLPKPLLIPPAEHSGDGQEESFTSFRCAVDVALGPGRPPRLGPARLGSMPGLSGRCARVGVQATASSLGLSHA